MHLTALAAEALDKGLWYPTILGVLAVVAAIVLFCGSVYLLLGTNLGARLGFLVAFTALMGWMTVLSVMWVTTASPLNTLKGRLPKWSVVEVVASPSKSSEADVRDLQAKGRTVDPTEAANVKASVDAALVTPSDPNAAPGEFNRFSLVTDYKVVKTYEIGGSSPNPLSGELLHKRKLAVVTFCEVQKPDLPFGVPPPAPKCNPDSTKGGAIVLERDLGSVRFPPLVALVMSALLFGLGLLLLHWREKDERALKRARAAEPPATTPAPVNA